MKSTTREETLNVIKHPQSLHGPVLRDPGRIFRTRSILWKLSRATELIFLNYARGTSVGKRSTRLRRRLPRGRRPHVAPERKRRRNIQLRKL